MNTDSENKSAYFEVIVPASTSLINMGFWAKRYKHTEFYGFIIGSDYVYNYFAFDEQKSLDNVISLIKAAFDNDLDIQAKIIKNKEEFEVMIKNCIAIVPFKNDSC